MSEQGVSIVVPTYREAANIPVLAERVFSALDAAGLQGELIIVDDDSRDGSVEAVEAIARKWPARIVVRTDERGLSSAVVRGFSEAQHGVLVCMDADLSHPPETVPKLVAPIAGGESDFAIGSRYAAGGSTEGDWGLFRKLNSLVATWLARPLTKATDPMAGFFCLRRETFEAARGAGLNPIGYKIGLELLIKSRCRRPVEIPIAFANRLHGESKLTLRQQLLYLRHLVSLYRFRWPWLLPAMFIALLLALFGVYRALR